MQTRPWGLAGVEVTGLARAGGPWGSQGQTPHLTWGTQEGRRPGPLVVRWAGFSGALPASRRPPWALQHPADWGAGPPRCRRPACGVLWALPAPRRPEQKPGRRKSRGEKERLPGGREQPTLSLSLSHTRCPRGHHAASGRPGERPPPPPVLSPPRARPLAREPKSCSGAASASGYLAEKPIRGPTGSPWPPLPAQTEQPALHSHRAGLPCETEKCRYSPRRPGGKQAIFSPAMPPGPAGPGRRRGVSSPEVPDRGRPAQRQTCTGNAHAWPLCTRVSTHPGRTQHSTKTHRMPVPTSPARPHLACLALTNSCACHLLGW